MKYAFAMFFILAATALLQIAVLPSILPAVLLPDLMLLVGITALAFAPREFALVLLFLLGVQADLFGSAKFGLLTLCYLLAAGTMLWAAWRELTTGDSLAACIGCIAGTLLAHTLYVGIGRFCGVDLPWGQGLAKVLSLVLASIVWSLPVGFFFGGFMYRLGVVALPVREKWAAEARLKAARRGKISRA